MALTATSSFPLNTSRADDSTTILGSPFQYLITFPVKKFFLLLISACAAALLLATRASSQEKAGDTEAEAVSLHLYEMKL